MVFLFFLGIAVRICTKNRQKNVSPEQAAEVYILCMVAIIIIHTNRVRSVASVYTKEATVDIRARVLEDIAMHLGLHVLMKATFFATL